MKRWIAVLLCAAALLCACAPGGEEAPPEEIGRAHV